MFNGFCGFGDWGSFGSFGLGSLIGVILNLIVLVGLIAGLTLLVFWIIRRAQVHPGTALYTTRQPNTGGQNTTGGLATAREILQAQYARGEITREQYEHMKQDIG